MHLWRTGREHERFSCSLAPFSAVFLSCSLLREPGEYLSSLTEAVGDVVSTIDPKYLSEGDIRITFTGG
jgi:hypothetical protein